MSVFSFGVVMFPGTLCDLDVLDVLKDVLHQNAEPVWHRESDPPLDIERRPAARKATEIHNFDCIIIPGGFSYGDYLRTGAMAQVTPVMEEVKKFAEQGGLVIGICNGFQILTESGLLPGAFLHNDNLQFVCDWVHIRCEQTDSPLTNQVNPKQVLRIPVAHGEGNYYCDEATLAQLNERGQVVFRYCTEEGETTSAANPNGSLENIAGIKNQQGNVLGIMPHPERCSENLIGGTDGLYIWNSILTYLEDFKPKTA